MFKTITPLSVALVATLFASCQGISKAPKGSARMELEVVVQVDPSFTGKLQGADQELTQAITDQVLSKADLGLRFYPVLTSAYDEGDPRPEYVMTVQIQDLNIGLDHRTIKHKDAEPTIETSVKNVACVAAVSMEKVRSSGPNLTVGSASGKGQKSASKVGEGETPASYAMVRDEGAQPLNVTRADLLAAVDSATDRAMKGIIDPVDREITMKGADEHSEEKK